MWTDHFKQPSGITGLYSIWQTLTCLLILNKCHSQPFHTGILKVSVVCCERNKHLLITISSTVVDQSFFAEICCRLIRSLVFPQRQAAGPRWTQRVVYLLTVLSRPRAHFWCHRLHGKHWHLVSRLRTGRAAARTTHIPRWQWGGPTSRDYQGECVFSGISVLLKCVCVYRATCASVFCGDCRSRRGLCVSIVAWFVLVGVLTHYIFRDVSLKTARIIPVVTHL